EDMEIQEYKTANNAGPGTGYLKSPFGNETLYSYSTWYYNHNCQCMVQVYVWIFCGWPSKNCLPQVVINGSSAENIVNAVTSFNACYNNSDVPGYFSDTTYRVLFPNIDSLNGIIDSIVDEEIVLNKFYNSHDGTDYYIGLPSGVTLSDNWDAWISQARCVIRICDQR
ncbi:MAG: hypothetical protein JXA03_15105, partial [Bacteroidales bacterium]|nr:hypothetical protein [Bacteroidales bacterium]